MSISSDEEFNRYSISVRDFEKSIEFITQATKNRENTVVHEALIFAAVICYYRPFSPNEKQDFSKAIARIKIEDFTLSQEEKEIHDFCGVLRNKALAHSEFSYNPTRLEPEGIIWSKSFSLLSTDFNRQSFMNNFLSLVNKMKYICNQRRAAFSRSRQRPV